MTEDLQLPDALRAPVPRTKESMRPLVRRGTLVNRVGFWLTFFFFAVPILVVSLIASSPRGVPDQDGAVIGLTGFTLAAGALYLIFFRGVRRLFRIACNGTVHGGKVVKAGGNRLRQRYRYEIVFEDAAGRERRVWIETAGVPPLETTSVPVVNAPEHGAGVVVSEAIFPARDS